MVTAYAKNNMVPRKVEAVECVEIDLMIGRAVCCFLAPVAILKNSNNNRDVFRPMIDWWQVTRAANA